MRHLVRNSCMVLALLVLLSAYIWPVSDTIRQGKDLRGGFSLTYQLQIDASQNADEVMNTTITVLKDRVDPTGTMDLSIVPQGRDRIEITMPLPNETIKKMRSDYLQMLQDIRDREITGRDFDRMLAMEDQDQQAEIDRLAGENEARKSLMARAVTLLAEERAASEKLRLDTENQEPADVIDNDVAAIAAASIQLDMVRDELLSTVLVADDLQNALGLSDKERAVHDDDADEPYMIPSPREKAVALLEKAHPDELATITAVLAKFDEYRKGRNTLDDPSDLIRLLQGSGVLEFRIAPGIGDHVEEQTLRQKLRDEGPRLASTRDALWFPLADETSWVNSIQQAKFMEASPVEFFQSRNFVVEVYEGTYYMLLWDTTRDSLTQNGAQNNWRVARSFETTDEQGRPAVGFRMDVNGGTLLGKLTEANVQKPMAVLLDNKVFTAPNLIGKISSQGQITGIDSALERAQIIRTLNAGTLTATLSPNPISQSILGPELGQDNLDAGLLAGIAALILVSVFMVVYYFMSGIIAVVALMCNAILILGMIVLGNVTLTLPGIAGIILTFGMAVDANVLIFERIREERRNGLDLRPAIKLGYSKALSSIVDGNVTNLIVCLVLANIGTQEIKGFAITLGIGVVGTLFSALVISRLIFGLMTEKMAVRNMPMLPSVVQPIEKLLEPKIDWLKFRVVFIIISICYVSLGIGMIVKQGAEMLDTEFRGGTAITMRFKLDDNGERVTMTRPEVAAKVAAIGDAAGENDETRLLSSAQVLPVDPADDGITSETFRIKTLATNSETIGALLNESFADVLPTKPKLNFDEMDTDDLRIAPVYAITENRLGQIIDRPDITADVSDYSGGVAILLNNITPAASEAELRERIKYMRRDQQFSSLLSRDWDIIILDGTPESIGSAAFVVLDEGLSVFESKDRWDAEVAGLEWSLIRQALARSESLAGIGQFDPAVASTFRGKAVAAVSLSLLLITIYIWVRFGSVRYSLAALVALMHDVLTAIGLIALAEILYNNPSTNALAQQLNIMPFKIDLGLIAALLTIIGYSLNDSIIIMDRIRENKGKLEYASRKVVNLSINQTISRTVITSGTTLTAVIILYAAGGEGVRAFSFTLLVGVLVGTYSSVAVAAPLVWSAKADRSLKASLAAEQAKDA
jgi:SecD/SecF fusion protein